MTTNTNAVDDSGVGGSPQVGGKRFLFNWYNQQPRGLRVFEDTDSWTYKTATTRQVQAVVGNKVEFITGVVRDAMIARSCVGMFNAGYTGTGRGGLALDSTTTFHGQYSESGDTSSGNHWTQLHGSYAVVPEIGYHYISWNENGGGGTGTMLWLGDDGGNMRAELSALVWG